MTPTWETISEAEEKRIKDRLPSCQRKEAQGRI
jgi:hypothetical protein